MIASLSNKEMNTNSRMVPSIRVSGRVQYVTVSVSRSGQMVPDTKASGSITRLTARGNSGM